MTDHFKSRVTFILSFSIICGVLIFDRITKVFFSSRLIIGESIPIIKNILHFTLVNNTGIAFGLFRNQNIVFIIVPVVAVLILMIFCLRSKDSRNHSDVYAFSLVLGGAIGNLIDRISFGHVIDFIDFRVWPVFNIADSAITVGVTIVCVNSFVTWRKESIPKKK